MNAFFKLFVLVSLLYIAGCSNQLPEKDDYLGVYRIIKIIEDSETIKTPTLNQIELKDDFYISRIDRNGDNIFSEEEISKSTYIFDRTESNEPFISISGIDSIVMLLPDKYYDLLFKRVDEKGRETILYTKKVR